MARPSILPTFPTVAAAHAALTNVHAVNVKGTPVGLLTRTKSGSEWADLTRRMHDDDARCVVCNLDTVWSRWDGPQAATLAHLLSPAFILASLNPSLYGADTTEGEAYRALRVGNVPGNLAVMCRACVDAAAAYGAANDTVWVWDAATLAGADRVWTSWPTLRKSSKPDVPTGDLFRSIVRAAREHTSNAARARASQGLPF